MHWSPSVPAQGAHIAPPMPQAVLSVDPETHFAPLQQPALHCPGPVQAVVHLWSLHAVPATGQSADELQPHAPATHVVPVELPVQLMHADAEPHAVVEVPDMHVPIAPPQQSVGPQPPPSQSAEQLPPTHEGVSPLHGMHWPPADPHSDLVSPATHDVPSQHPPLHVRPPLQLVPQKPVALQASPFPQLVDVHRTWVSLPDSGGCVMSAATSRVESNATSGPPSPQGPTQPPSSSREHAEVAAAPKRSATATQNRVHIPPIVVSIPGRASPGWYAVGVTYAHLLGRGQPTAGYWKSAHMLSSELSVMVLAHVPPAWSVALSQRPDEHWVSASHEEPSAPPASHVAKGEPEPLHVRPAAQG
jgi:hypothetical protein